MGVRLARLEFNGNSIRKWSFLKKRLIRKSKTMTKHNIYIKRNIIWKPNI